MYCSVVIFSRPLDPLSYELKLNASVGTIVQVPLGRSSCTGIITEISEQKPAYEGKIRHVLEIVDPNPFITPALMKTLVFMSTYYQCALGFCLKLALPGGMMRSGKCRYFAGLLPEHLEEENCHVIETKQKIGRNFELFPEENAKKETVIEQIFSLLETSETGLTETELCKRFKVSAEQFSSWVECGALVPQWSLDQERQKESTEAVYAIVESAEMPSKLGKKQQAVYDWMIDSGGSVRHNQVLEKFGSCNPVLNRLKELGLISERATVRDKTSFDDIVPEYHEVERTDEQNEAIARVVSHEGFGSFLLFGVTGSGKTEVYLGVMEAVRARGKGCIARDCADTAVLRGIPWKVRERCGRIAQRSERARAI